MNHIARNNWIRFGVGAALLAASAFLVFWARGHAEAVTATFLPFSRRVQAFLSQLVRGFSFPLTELILYAGIVCLVFFLFLSVRAALRSRSACALLRFASFLVLAIGTLVFWFFGAWGLNYYALPLETRLQRPTKPQGAQTLFETTRWLRDEMIAVSDKVSRTQGGVFDAGGFDALSGFAPDGFAILSQTRPGLFYPKTAVPKKFIASPLLSKLGFGGVFSPFWGEPMINWDAVDAHLPFTLCHEMAHAMGFAFEGEANFVAFLAATHNPAYAYRYSGYHLAFIYCSNALSSVDETLYAEIWANIPDSVHADFRAQREHLQQNKGALTDAGSTMNDAYLKIMNQPAGEKSYGLVVDLLISEYLARAS